MKTYASHIILTALLLSLAATAPAFAFPTRAQEGREFEFRVRELFFQGLRGDAAAHDEAMRLCEEALAADPDEPEALVWHGSGLVFRAGQAYESGNFAAGGQLLSRGLSEMNRAVELAPDRIEILIPRATTLVALADNTPMPALATDYRRTAAADLEKVWELQRPYFERISVHGRGELMTGLANAYLKLGDADRALEILTRVTTDLPGSSYAVEARRVLGTASGELATRVKTCHGCHEEER